MRGGAKAIDILHAKQGQQYGQVLRPRRGLKMGVHGVRAGEQFAEGRGLICSMMPGRRPTTTNSARPPSPRSRTCWPGRCRRL